MKGYLRKINKYPVTLQNPQTKFTDEKKWLTDGNYNFDKICSSLSNSSCLFFFKLNQNLSRFFYKGLSLKSIEEILDENKDLAIIHK